MAKDLLKTELAERFTELKVFELDKIESGQSYGKALASLTGQTTVPNIFLLGKVCLFLPYYLLISFT
jgi:hypothetical protein